MRKLLFVLSVFLSGNCFAQFKQKDFTLLHVVVGSWQVQKTKGTIIEEWKLKDDSTLIGYSYFKTLTDSIVPQENITLSFRQGIIMYTPVTAGQNEEKPVHFTLTTIKKGKYFFENKAHDFPSLITYHLVDNNTLNAAISGMMSGELREIPYNYTRQL